MRVWTRDMPGPKGWDWVKHPMQFLICGEVEVSGPVDHGDGSASKHQDLSSVSRTHANTLTMVVHSRRTWWPANIASSVSYRPTKYLVSNEVEDFTEGDTQGCLLASTEACTVNMCSHTRACLCALENEKVCSLLWLVVNVPTAWQG